MSRRKYGRVVRDDRTEGHKTERFNAPLESPYRASTALPYEGPRTPEEWQAAIAEMAANDETFREWRSAEISAELTAKTVAVKTAVARDEADAFDVERVA